MKKNCFIVALAGALLIPFNGNSQIAFSLNTGLATVGSNGASACVIDMNGDFLDDLVTIGTGNNLNIFYQNAPGNPFTPSTHTSLSASGLWSICGADYDDNGFNDLLLGDGSFVEFVKANATGTAYTPLIQPDYIFSQRTNFVDINNDGHLDAFACHDIDQSHPFRNDGAGNLTYDISLMPVLSPLRGNYSSLWLDYDNDRDIDLYITKCAGGALVGDPERVNLLYQNDGNGNYTEVALAAGMADSAQSWTTVFADFDNDGDFDGFTVNHDFQNRYFLNNDDGTFTDIIGTTGINANDLGGWQGACGDFDNDGWIDIISDMGTRIYRNTGGNTFVSVPTAPSIWEAAMGDLNNDGFLDLFSGSAIYLNDGNANGYLKLNMEGTVSNRSAIGARIEIVGAGWGRQIREVRSGESFSPGSSLTVHFGLGTTPTIDTMTVYWPSGLTEQWTNVAASQTLHLIEGATLSTIDRPNIIESLKLYPNPASDQVTVSFDAELIGTNALTFNVYDSKGALVKTVSNVTQAQFNVNVSDLQNGTYIYQLVSNTEPIAAGKLNVGR
jgi:hypothetical protein